MWEFISGFLIGGFSACYGVLMILDKEKPEYFDAIVGYLRKTRQPNRENNNEEETE